MFAKFALAALILLGAAPAAFADRTPQFHSFVVSFGDLNVSSPAGGRTLLQRIEKAARKVCRVTVPNSPLAVRQAIECRRETIETTVSALGMPALTLAWNGKYPTTTLASR